MRVYLPATIPLLARLERERELTVAEGYAVTAGLRAWCGADDEEELEYAALTAAARASLRLLAAEPEAVRRRVVVAADIPDARVAEPPEAAADPGVIEITGAVRLADMASLHLDEAAAEQAVAAAAAALGAADAGEPDAVAALDAAEDHDLLWYGTQELGDLL